MLALQSIATIYLHLILFLLPCIVTESVSFNPGSLVLAPNRDNVCFAARIMEQSWEEHSNLCKVRFLSPKIDTVMEISSLLNVSEWLTVGQIVFVMDDREPLSKVVQYEQCEIAEVVERKGQFPRYRVRLESPRIIHKMVNMSNIGISRQRVDSELRAREQEAQARRYLQLLEQEQRAKVSTAKILISTGLITAGILGCVLLNDQVECMMADGIALMLVCVTVFAIMLVLVPIPLGLQQYLVSSPPVRK